MEKRKWFLELSLEGQEDASIKEHICFPLYYNNYKDAIRTILLKVLKEKKERKAFEDKFPYRISDDEGNIISFLGRRGSGKTTAMVEFCQILDDLNSESAYRFWLERAFSEPELIQELKDEKFVFRILPRIDVSSLESKEDIFELIMSELYRLYISLKDEHRREFQSQEVQRSILQKFHLIMKGYYAIRDSREDDFGDSYISRLDYMCGSFDLRKKIEELITEMFGYIAGSKTKCFVVIALDDLDLNVSHGYDMLEQLHKYFFNRHTLITMSADYQQLNSICKIHYIRDFSIGRSHVIESMVKDSCSKLARDYITKIMPVDSRVFMPDWNKMVRRFVVRSEKYGYIAVKYYVMGRLAQKMQIYHDINGLKKHFVEQETVRDLANYDQFLDSLLDIPYVDWKQTDRTHPSNKDYMERYDQNHERYNNDVLNRLANHLLTEEQWDSFQKLISFDLERRAERACEIFRKEVISYTIMDEEGEAPESDEKENFLPQKLPKTMRENMILAEAESQESHVNKAETNSTKADNKYADVKYEDTKHGSLKEDISVDPHTYDPLYDYSFGSLLQGIFEYGRCDNEDSGKNKAFIKCVLASFTSEMVREKISYARNGSESSRQHSYRRISRFLGKRIGNPWLADMMPMLQDESGMTYRTGFYRKEFSEKSFAITIAPIHAHIIDNLPDDATWKQIEQELESLKREIEENKILPSLEWLYFFVSMQKSEDVNEANSFPFEFWVEYTAKSSGKSRTSKKYILQMALKKETFVISLWEFIGKTVDVRKSLEDFHNALSLEMSRALCSYKGIVDQNQIVRLKEIFLDWIKKNSLFCGYLENKWDTDVFPYCNFDLAYNVMKRARRELLEEKLTVASNDKLLDWVGHAYDTVRKHLEDEDKKYGLEAHIKTSFADNFANFPIVNMIINKTYTQLLRKDVIKYLESLLSANDCLNPDDIYVDNVNTES